MGQPILILGAKTREDRPSPILESRLKASLPLIEESSVPVVASGLGEAGVMARWLAEHGVDPRRIVEEPRATSTNENLEQAQALLSDTLRWRVVTSGFHLWRTRLWAWHLGIPVSMFAARTPTRSWLPMLARECLALPHSALRILWRRWRAR